MSLKDYMSEKLWLNEKDFDDRWDDDFREIILEAIKDDQLSELVSDFYVNEYEGNGYVEFGEVSDFTEIIVENLENSEDSLTEFQNEIIYQLKDYVKDCIEEKWNELFPVIISDIHEARLENQNKRGIR